MEEEIMRKAFGLGLALVLSLSLTAFAEEVTGKVTAIDRATGSFVLDDGTQLSASESQLADMAIGDEVKAAYEARGDAKFVTGMDRRPGTDWNYLSTRERATGTVIDSVQTGD
jgi:hypothetical protein